MTSLSQLLNRKRQVGSTSVHVPALGFGGAAIGNLYRAIDDATAKATIDRALEQGIRYFDTAPHYGFGLSESRLGSALSNASHAQDVLVSSKVGRVLVPVSEAEGRKPRHGF